MSRQARLCVLVVGVIGTLALGTSRVPLASTRPASSQPGAAQAESDDSTDGALRLSNGDFCPLKRTDVDAQISGFVARVTVTQHFTNPTGDRVEAIYTFPLPQDAAVDRMAMNVGDRVIRAVIKRREEAQEIYARAREAGHTASLLEQERPNIFTQSVANIPPHGAVRIEISYVDLLQYEGGRYAFVFPMVVGPRYIPGASLGTNQGRGWANDTRRVPDASRITPPVAGVHFGTKGTRAGHDISMTVDVDAGRAIDAVESVTHQTDVERRGSTRAVVRLRKASEIPNRDFVLTYDAIDATISDAVLVHNDPAGRGGHFALVLQPPERIAVDEVTPRELVFVLDTSGSMSGFPVETAKAVMRRAIESLRIGDTFNLITFSGDTRVLFPEPVFASAGNIQRALAFLDEQRGGGGTEMMKAIRAALGPARPVPETRVIPIPPAPGNDGPSARPIPPAPRDDGADPRAVRVVCFMTDGYVGNDQEILGAIKERPRARVFSFGIGSSVNRFLLDGMAREGRGDVEYVLRHEDAQQAADRFYERINTPVLTDITIDWGGLPVAEVVPARVPDLFAAKPVVVLGRYTAEANGTITLRGHRGGLPFSRTIRVALPAVERQHDAVAQLWARRQVGELSSQDWLGAQRGTVREDLRQKIERLGLDYALVTAFTAFVAVEDRVIVEGGERRTVQVPVEMPQNVSQEGVFGETAAMQMVRVGGNVNSSMAMTRSAPGMAGGVPGGVVGGVVGGLPSAPPPPPHRTQARDATPEIEPDTFTSRADAALVRLVRCSESLRESETAATKCGVPATGRVAIRIVLATVPSADVLQRLAEAGLNVTPPSGHTIARMVEGTIAVDRLRALAEVPEVRLIALKQ